MSTFKPCDFTDCPAHPDYKVETIENTLKHVKSNIYWAANVISSEHISTPRSNIRFKVDDIDVSIECLVCKHLNKIDMRERLIVEKTKKELMK